MSYITVFDVPHIFRYGITDEEEGKTWQLFYRNATCFCVEIRKADIAGTPFEERWSRYCVETGDPFQNWRDLCNCVVAHILPTLQELAPTNARTWHTLQDYLDTPIYQLQLFKDDAIGDAVALIVSATTPAGAPFDMQPQPFSELFVPQELPRIDASNLIVVDHEQDWRQDPGKVRLLDSGAIASLIVAKGSSEAVETGIVTNHSLLAMAKVLECFRVAEDINITKPMAIVTATKPSDPEPKIAGILHTRIPETAVRLADLSANDLLKASSEGLVDQWKAQVAVTLETLHAHHIVHGALHQYLVWIDPMTGAWTILHGGPGFIVEGKAGSKEEDLESLDNLFDVWLKQKMDKVKPMSAVL